MKPEHVNAMLIAASVERSRIASFIEHQAEIHEALEGEIEPSGKGVHADIAKQLYELADRIRGGVL